jgi:hypothetical protein
MSSLVVLAGLVRSGVSGHRTGGTIHLEVIRPCLSPTDGSGAYLPGEAFSEGGDLPAGGMSGVETADRAGLSIKGPDWPDGRALDPGNPDEAGHAAGPFSLPG